MVPKNLLKDLPLKKLLMDNAARAFSQDMDGRMDRIYADKLVFNPTAEWTHFVSLRAASAKGHPPGYPPDWPFDIQRSDNPLRYKLFEWLDENCVGVWQTGSNSIRFSHEEDAALFRIKFAD